MGLSDRYDDFRNSNLFFQGTRANINFDPDDIMNHGEYKLSKAHYENWLKHAQMRAKTYLGPINAGPFSPLTNRPESYFESSIKKIDSKGGMLQNPKFCLL